MALFEHTPDDEEERKRKEAYAGIISAVASLKAKQEAQIAPKPAYDPTAGAKYPPKEEAKPVYRVQRQREAQKAAERAEGIRTYQESERADYRRDTSKPLLSYLPEREEVGLAEPERPDTGPARIAPAVRSWDTVTLEEGPQPEPEEVGLRRPWQPLPVPGTSMALSTPATTGLWAAPIVGNAAQVSAGAVGNWFEQWRNSVRADSEAAPSTAIGSTFGPRASTQAERDTLAQTITDLPANQYALQNYRDRTAEIDKMPEGFAKSASQAGSRAWLGVEQVFDVPYRTITSTVDPVTGLPAIARLAAVGSAINQGMNVFNPNEVTNEELAAQGYAPNAIGRWNWMADEVDREVAKWGETMDYLDTAPEEVRQQALLASQSGPDRVRQAAENLVNKEARIAQLQRDMQRAQAEGRYEDVNIARAELVQLGEESWAETVTASIRPAADFVANAIFDPTNFIGLPIKQGVAATKAHLLMNISPEQALKNIDNAFAPEPVQRLLKNIGGDPAAKRIGQRVLSLGLARTPESQAALDTEVLYKAIVQMIAPLNSAGDVRRVIDDLVTTGGKNMVRGMDGMASAAEVGGRMVWGPGIVANKELAPRLPYLQAIGDQLRNMRSLAKPDDAFNPIEFLSELGENIYGVARQANGLPTKGVLPFGATDVRLRKVGANEAVLEYTTGEGKKLKVVHKSAKMDLSDAEELSHAAAATPTGGVIDALSVLTLAKVQKAIMSDMFLALRPANWIRNALSAGAMLAANDSYTWRSGRQIERALARKFGGVQPTVRLQGSDIERLGRSAASEVGSGAIDKVLGVLPKNPVSEVGQKIMRAAYNIPYGSTEIRAGQNSLPIGEQAFYKKSYYTNYTRAEARGIGRVVRDDLVPAAQQAGLAPKQVRDLKAVVETAAREGTPQDVRRAVREWANALEQKLDVRDALGLSGEDFIDLEINGVPISSFLQDVARRYGPGQEQTALAETGAAFKGMRAKLGAIGASTGDAPLARYTLTEMIEEAELVAQNIAAAATRAGVPADVAKKQGDEIAQKIVRDMQDSVQRLMSDVELAPASPKLGQVIGDYFLELNNLKAEYREAVDTAFRAIQEAPQPQRSNQWRLKWEATRAAADRLRAGTVQLGDEYRQIVQQIGNPTFQYKSRHDWDDLVRKYLDFDMPAYERARALNPSLGSTKEAPAVYGQVIESFRGRLDRAIFELVEIAKRNPSLENFEIVGGMVRNLDLLGARVRAMLDPQLDEALAGTGSGMETYYRQRNEAWLQKWLDEGLKQTDTAKQQMLRKTAQAAPSPAQAAPAPSVMGQNITATVSDYVDGMLEHLDRIEARAQQMMPELLKPRPNTLTSAQRLAIVNAADDLAPRLDNVMAEASHLAEDMSNWNMLNFSDKRDLDTILGLGYAFPYFWSRMPARGLMAALSKPGLLNFYFGAKDAIAKENAQTGVPTRLQGTVPNPTHNTRFPIGPERVQVEFLLDSVIPGMMYLNPNPFVDPSEATNDVERWWMNLQKFTPGLYPLLTYVGNAASGRGNADFQLGDVVPLYRGGYYFGMSKTGNIPENAGGIFSGGDQYDYGRIGRGVEEEGQAQPLDARRWARDVVYQAQTGSEPLPEAPTDGSPEALAQAGAMRAGGDRFVTWLTGFLGLPMYSYSEEEQLAREAQATRRTLGYDPLTNPAGSHAAVKEFDETAEGQAAKGWTEYTNLYPQDGAPRQAPAGDVTPAENAPAPLTYPYRQPFGGETRPGAIAAKSERSAETDTVYDTYAPQIETLDAEIAALKEKIAATPKGDALYALYDEKEIKDKERDALYDAREAEIAAIKGRYPSVKDGEVQQEEVRPSIPTGIDPTAGTQPAGNADYYGTYSPRELAETAAVNAERMAKEKYKEIEPNWDAKPVYPDAPAKGAGSAAWAAFKAAKAQYDADADAFYAGVDEYNRAVEDEIERLMQNPSGLVYGRPTGRDVPEPVSPYTPLRGGKATLATETTGEIGETDAGPILLTPKEIEDIRKTESKAAQDFEKQRAGGGGGSGGGGGGKGFDAPGRAPNYGEYWDAYNAFGDDWAAKAEFMRNNPLFAAYYKEKYGKDSAWWERERSSGGSYARSYGGGGYSYGGGGGSDYDENAEYRMDAYVAPREYDKSLMPQARYLQGWRPLDVGTQWIQAGANLRPQPLPRWRVAQR